jgi:hypothetical protein
MMDMPLLPKKFVLRLVLSAAVMAGALVFGLLPDGMSGQRTTVAMTSPSAPVQTFPESRHPTWPERRG